MGSKTEHPRHLGNQLIIPGAARISQRWDLRSYDMLRGDDTLLQTLRDKLSVPPTTWPLQTGHTAHPEKSSTVQFKTQYLFTLTLLPEARTAHLSLLHSMTHLDSNANNEAPLYTTFPSLLSFPPFRFQYFPQHTVLKHLLFLYSSPNVPRIYKPFPVNVMRTAQITWLLIMHFSQASNYSLHLKSK